MNVIFVKNFIKIKKYKKKMTKIIVNITKHVFFVKVVQKKPLQRLKIKSVKKRSKVGLIRIILAMVKDVRLLILELFFYHYRIILYGNFWVSVFYSAQYFIKMLGTPS